MADSQEGPSVSTLNPAAPPFSMESNKTAHKPGPATAPIHTQNNVNGTPSTQKLPKKQDKPPSASRSTTAENIAEAGAGVKLTGAELKKQKAAEKAARRAEKVAEKGVVVQEQSALQTQAQVVLGRPNPQRRLSSGRKDGDPHHRRTGSSSGKQLPLRNGPPTETKAPEKPVEDKRVGIFSHLYPREARATIANAGKEIHPAILTLGIQLRDHVVCGSSARCVAMLLVFKKVIQSYDTPPGVALSRHLTTHLSHQISFLSRARPLGVAQGNAIRWLKKVISGVDPSMGDGEAKKAILETIDAFIRERVILAGEVISRDGSGRIRQGDTIVTFAKSSVVEKTLIKAHEEGKTFKVIVVDSRPLFEGRNLARSLGKRGIEVTYVLLSGLGEALRKDNVTKCVLGASAMFGNGALYSRAGTAMLAMMCKTTAMGIPVIVLCESIKFTGRVALDSVLMNEVAEADTLVEVEENEIIAQILPPPAEPTPSKGGKRGGKDEAEPDSTKERGLEGWRDQRNLQLLNLMYDVTPVEYLDMVITELGSMPPSAVPVVNGVHGGED